MEKKKKNPYLRKLYTIWQYFLKQCHAKYSKEIALGVKTAFGLICTKKTITNHKISTTITGTLTSLKQHLNGTVLDLLNRQQRVPNKAEF